MKMNRSVGNALASLATTCCFAAASPCPVTAQSDSTATQDQAQRSAKFATVRLDHGLSIGRPSGWRVKRSGSSVTLVPPASVGVSVVVSIGPWDGSMRLDNDADQERLRESHIAAAPGFLAAGEPMLGNGWVALDYERDAADNSDAAMRIFVRPVGDHAVTLAVVGARPAIDRGERDWASIADTIAAQPDAGTSEPGPATRGSTEGRDEAAGRSQQDPSAAKGDGRLADNLKAAQAVLETIKAIDSNGGASKDVETVRKVLKAGSDVAAALESVNRAGKGGAGEERLQTAIDLAGKISIALQGVDAGGGAGGVTQSEKAAAASSAVRAVSDAIAAVKRDGGGNAERVDAAIRAVQSISESLQNSGAATGDSKGVQDLQKALSAATGIAAALGGFERGVGGNGTPNDLDAAIRAGAQVAKALQGGEAGGAGNVDAMFGLAAAVAEAVKSFDKDTDKATERHGGTENGGSSDGGDRPSLGNGAATEGSNDDRMEDGAGSSDQSATTEDDAHAPGEPSPRELKDEPNARQDGAEVGADRSPADGGNAPSSDEQHATDVRPIEVAPKPSQPDVPASQEPGTVLKLDQGWTITLPRGWSAVESEGAFQLRTPARLSEAAAEFEGAIGIIPWDESSRIDDPSVLAKLRQQHTESLDGYGPVGEPLVRQEWAAFDYASREGGSGTKSARVFVRPIGSQAVAIFVMGTSEFIADHRADWESMASSIRKGSKLSGLVLGSGKKQQQNDPQPAAPKPDGLRMTTNQEGGYSVRHDPAWTVKNDGPATVLMPSKEPADPNNPEFYGLNAVPWDKQGALDEGDNPRQAVQDLMREAPALKQDGRIEKLGGGAILGRFSADTEAGKVRLVILARIVSGNLVALVTSGNDATIAKREAKARTLFATLKEAGRAEAGGGAGAGAGVAQVDLQFAGRWSTEEVLSSGGGFDAGGSASMVTQRILELGRDGRFTFGSRSAGGGSGATFESGLSVDARGTWSIERGGGSTMLVLRTADGNAQRVRCTIHEGQLVVGEPGARKFYTRID